ncbi:MAG TPA: YkgJ family cysteine cluster protein [Terracidiphilus sp.]|nr:YkgJ family cysteine cluster protein [Terracidiphilus sp.]
MSASEARSTGGLMPADSSNSADATSVKATFTLPVGNASLHAAVQLPAGHTTPTQLLPIIQDLESTIIDQVSREASAAGRPISCRAGCGACCRQMVPISLFEAEALTEWLHTLPEERQAALRLRFQAALKALRDAGVLETFLSGSWNLDEESCTQFAVDYFHVGAACPFLENESCSIHPIRPLSCREYLVTSSPELCRDPSVHELKGVILPLRPSRAMFLLGRHVDQDRRGWIPLVFLLAFAERGIKPGDYLAATGPAIFRQFLDYLLVSKDSDPTGAENQTTS